MNSSFVFNTLESLGLENAKIIADSAYTWISVVGATVFLWFVYWLFYIPCDWTKCINDVGYDLAIGNKKFDLRHKNYGINRIQRLRKIGVGELPPPYPNGWYCILESSGLKAGEVKNVDCIGQHFAVYRTKKNKVYVLDAYCPHMGANLGVGGQVDGDNIICPFHQWSFRGSDGQCVNIPYSGCAPASSKIKKWISREIMDFIFIWYHVDSVENTWELPIIKEIQNKEFVYHGRNEFYVNCHIQEIPENGADLAHFTAIHSESALAGSSNPKRSSLANAGNHQWQAMWKPSVVSNKHIASILLEHSVELTPKFSAFHMDVVGQQIGPSYVQLHMSSPTLGRFEVLQTVTPVEPLVQKVIHRFYAPRILAPLMKVAVFGESVMFERDVAMWNNKTYRSNPKLVKEDISIKAFRNWYQQFYSDNSIPFVEARENLQW